MDLCNKKNFKNLHRGNPVLPSVALAKDGGDTEGHRARLRHSLRLSFGRQRRLRWVKDSWRDKEKTDLLKNIAQQLVNDFSSHKIGCFIGGRRAQFDNIKTHYFSFERYLPQKMHQFRILRTSRLRSAG